MVTMDGFTGYATAVEEQLPQANKVMDPFHVVHQPTNSLHADNDSNVRPPGAADAKMTRCTSTGAPC